MIGRKNSEAKKTSDPPLRLAVFFQREVVQAAGFDVFWSNPWTIIILDQSREARWSAEGHLRPEQPRFTMSDKESRT